MKIDVIVLSFQRGKKSLPTHFNIGGTDQISSSILYCGMTLDWHLTLPSQVRQRLKLAQQNAPRFYHLLMCPQPSLHLKLQTYKLSLYQQAPQSPSMDISTAPAELPEFCPSQDHPRHQSSDHKKSFSYMIELYFGKVSWVKQKNHLKYYL